MAIRDYWVYQNRVTEKMWVLYIVKEYDKRVGKEATCLDFTFYHDDIPGATHSLSEVGLHYDSIAGYVNHFECAMLEYTTITAQDHEQLTKAIEDIIYH